MSVSPPNSIITWMGLATLPVAIQSEHVHDRLGVVQHNIDRTYLHQFRRLGQTSLPLEELRGGHLRPAQGQMTVASWNVEGLTEAKLVELQVFMAKHDVSILCLQETHKSLSDYYVTHDGFLAILSGTSSDRREFAGVGFLIAPWARQSIVSFCQASSRIHRLGYVCGEAKSSSSRHMRHTAINHSPSGRNLIKISTVSVDASLHMGRSW